MVRTVPFLMMSESNSAGLHSSNGDEADESNLASIAYNHALAALRATASTEDGLPQAQVVSAHEFQQLAREFLVEVINNHRASLPNPNPDEPVDHLVNLSSKPMVISGNLKLGPSFEFDRDHLNSFAVIIGKQLGLMNPYAASASITAAYSRFIEFVTNDDQPGTRLTAFLDAMKRLDFGGKAEGATTHRSHLSHDS